VGDCILGQRMGGFVSGGGATGCGTVGSASLIVFTRSDVLVPIAE
jgi:hypothetical protein